MIANDVPNRAAVPAALVVLDPLRKPTEGYLRATVRRFRATVARQFIERTPDPIGPVRCRLEPGRPGTVQLRHGELIKVACHAELQAGAKHLAGLRGLIDTLLVEPREAGFAVETALNVGLKRGGFAANRISRLLDQGVVVSATKAMS